ncbi:MAG: VanZ family protein, partial [bacterium]
MKFNCWLKKNLPLIGWLVFVIYVIYGTLIPFDFSLQLEDIAQSITRANFIPFYNEYEGRRFSIPDVVSNLLLFLPYGFLLYWGLQNRGMGIAKCKLICISSAFLFSSILEFLQVFSILRRSSVTDIINNTISTWIGCILSNIFLTSFKDRMFNQLNTLRQKNPLLLFLILYSLLILLVFMFPFDISIDVDDIKRGIKEINLTPFYYTQNSPSIIDMGINIFIFIIFGFLGYASFRIYHSRLL